MLDQEEIQKSELFSKFAFLQLHVSKERTKALKLHDKNDKNGRYFIFAKLIRTIFFFIASLPGPLHGNSDCNPVLCPKEGDKHDR